MSGRVAEAQLREAGEEFRVNTYTTGYQLPGDVCADAEGNFVVVWNSYQDGDGISLVGRRYDADGTAAGTEFAVNSYTTGDQFSPSVCCSAAGEFVVTWSDTSGQDGSYAAMMARRFGATGSPLGTEFVVNSYTTLHQWLGDVCCDQNGGFVVVWESNSGEDGDNVGIFGQRFSSAGAPSGTQFQVNTYTTDSQMDPAVTCSSDGAFVVSWDDLFGEHDGDSAGIWARAYDSSGSPVASELQVNTYTTGQQIHPSACYADSGDFVIAWESATLDLGHNGIFAQRFDQSATPVGSETEISQGLAYPHVACTDEGFVVALSDDLEGEDEYGGVFARVMTASMNPAGALFHVNSYTTHYQNVTAISRAGNGFVVVWSDYTQDGDKWGVFARRLDALCTITPMTGCKQPAIGQKSSIMLRTDAGDREKDSFRWKWLKGSETQDIELGDPTVDTSYGVCVYDVAGSEGLYLTASMPAAGTCAGAPCWSATSSGFRYRDDDGSPHDIRSAVLRAGDDEKAQIVVKGKGSRLNLPLLPLQPQFYPTILVQLQASSGTCWEASYSTHFLMKSTDKVFKAKAD